MIEPIIMIRLDDGGQAYQPGETLSGEYWLEAVTADEIKAVEVSVLWQSEGKGDQDLAVHEFWQRSAESGDYLLPRRPARFSTTLPHSPLSYDGQIVKIRWCVRVRAFLKGGKELLGEKVFRLGNVPPAQPQPATAEPAEAQDADGE